MRHVIEWYFEQGLELDGRWDMPLIRRQDVALDGLSLIRFTNAVKSETSDLGATVHFYEADEDFDEVWNDPEGHVAELAQYKQVMSPDFSLWWDMAAALQMVNTLRNRWCGAYWQAKGLTVIPTVSWGSGKSFDFCFAGIEQGGVVSVSTVGCKDARREFMRGYQEMLRAVRPEAVVCYGEPFEEMFGQSELVIVPYVRNQRIATRLRGDA